MVIVKSKKFKKNSDIKNFYNKYGWVTLKNHIKKSEIKNLQKSKEVLFELDIRDVAFFHKDLIHKSNFNNTNISRPVGIGRYISLYD